MTGFVVAILAGPGAAEAQRALDLLDALAHHEPTALDIVLVDDDADADAEGARRWPPTATVLRNPRERRGIGTLGGTCAGTLSALRWAHEHRPGAWVLRLDADSLVIGPVSERVAAAFAERPGVGILGCCHVTPNGETREHPWWGPVVRKHARPLWVWRRPPLPGRYAMRAVPAVRATVRAALEQGYRPGEHCIAAGCAIRSELIEALAGAGLLDDPCAWLATLFGDDVMLGAMARAHGWDLADAPDVFGVQHQGLCDTPAGLRDRGFGVVHSTKNDRRTSEDDVRTFFARERGGGDWA